MRNKNKFSEFGRTTPQQYFEGGEANQNYLYPLVIIALVGGLVAFGMCLAILLKNEK